MRSQFRFLIGGEVMEELIVKSIATIGIPGAICFFLLIKFSRSIDRLSDSITNLVEKSHEEKEEMKQDFSDVKHQLSEVKNLILKER